MRFLGVVGMTSKSYCVPSHDELAMHPEGFHAFVQICWDRLHIVFCHHIIFKYMPILDIKVSVLSAFVFKNNVPSKPFPKPN